MPYDYRRMTLEERAAIIAERRRRSYPLHSPPHPYREAGWYCIAAANYEHLPIMADTIRLAAFEDQLLSGLAAARVEVGGWVIVSNHYHILVGAQALEQISAVLKQVHGTTARAWNLEDGLTGRRTVWYKFWDRCIRDEHHYYRALNYIHYNATKHGYVESPYEWPWCSVHLYVETYGRQWLRERWAKYRIGDVWDYGDLGSD